MGSGRSGGPGGRLKGIVAFCLAMVLCSCRQRKRYGMGLESRLMFCGVFSSQAMHVGAPRPLRALVSVLWLSVESVVDCDA
jgi:hypothetical protein